MAKYSNHIAVTSAMIGTHAYPNHTSTDGSVTEMRSIDTHATAAIVTREASGDLAPGNTHYGCVEVGSQAAPYAEIAANAGTPTPAHNARFDHPWQYDADGNFIVGY